MAVLHESGHALYTRGLPEDWRRQPVGRNRGMTAHESQSLSIEMQACRSEAFAVPYARLLNEELAPAEDWEPARLYRVLNHVEPDLVRVEADEVSYPLHIIVRHRCETALVSGALDPADLPGAFDDAVEALLGIRPPARAKAACRTSTGPAGPSAISRHTPSARSWRRSLPKPCARPSPTSTGRSSAAISVRLSAGSGSMSTTGAASMRPRTIS